MRRIVQEEVRICVSLTGMSPSDFRNSVSAVVSLFSSPASNANLPFLGCTFLLTSVTSLGSSSSSASIAGLALNGWQSISSFFLRNSAPRPAISE